MSFVISGRICEQESKRPIPGLIVRVVDQENRFEHPRNVTTTDPNGLFRMEYPEQVVAALAKSRGQIHLHIYAPPWRLLLDVAQHIKWGASTEDRVDLKIPRKLLGPFSPVRPDGVVEAGIHLKSSALVIEQQGEFAIPHLPGFKNSGRIGAPTLPEQIQTIVLPLGARNLKLEVKPGRPVRLPAPIRPFPVQPPTPETGSQQPVVLTEIYPRYAQAVRPFPQEQVILGSSKRYHFMQVVSVRVQPVQYDPVKRNYLFYPNLSYTVHYDVPTAQQRKQLRFTESQLEEMQEFLDRATVFVAKDISADLLENAADWIYAPAMQGIDYLIIASNHTWPETASSQPGQGNPARPVPALRRPPHADEYLRTLGDDGQGNGAGPVAQFQRLAKWKTERGVRTLVVTVEQILEGTLGDFTVYNSVRARDLQEVIRNFLKKMHDDAPFHYLLLGGSRQVIPMRDLLAYVTCEGNYPAWDFSGVTAAPTAFPAKAPPPRCCAVDPDSPHKVRLCHDRILGNPVKETILCTGQGTAIHHKTTPGNGMAGWYFVQSDYSGYSDTPIWYPYNLQDSLFDETGDGGDICNIVVEGPDSVIDDHYYWAFAPERFLPSDLYYACLATNTGDAAGAQPHDWDLNGNKFYGQFRWDDAQQTEVTIDSTAPTLPDVWVGRAPIESGNEAKAFVDKVLTYERLCTPEGEFIDPAYLGRIVLAGDVMNGALHLAEQAPHTTDNGIPPAGTFVHNAADSSVLVHLQSDLVNTFGKSDGAQRHVLARYYRADHRGVDIPVWPKQPDAPGWQFMTQTRASQFSPSRGPSEFVKIEGAPFTVKPQRILWRFGPVDANDNGAGDCEELIANQFKPFFPAFDDIVRYYLEFLNFAPPLFDLTPAKIRAQLDRGCHFLVLRGHGNFNGVSMVWWYETEGFSPVFKNRGSYFIAYAQSCSTAQPDYVRNNLRIRSLGEAMVVHPEGGAVAYIGYTRIGVGGGKLQQELFWENLKAFGRLGRAAGTPYNGGVELDDMYQYYNQILYGDPNMPIWLEPPRNYEIVHPDIVHLSQDTIQITVLDNGHLVQNQRVTLLGGWHEDARQPEFFKTKVTGTAGTATFNLDNFPDELTELTLTVTCWPKGTNYIPFQITLPVVHT